MSPATLRNICVKKTSEMLTNGVWDTCRDNPFAFMPNSVVDQLLSSLWPSNSVLNNASIRHIRLLLMSNRLEHVDLTHDEYEGKYVTLLWMLSRGCQNLRTLTILWGHSYQKRNYIDEERLLDDLLQNSAKLEYLHTCVYFNPNALRNCRNLKTLRLHSLPKSTMFLSGVTSDLLKGFNSIEVFAVCRFLVLPQNKDDFSAALTILDNCPQLTTLGVLDSSIAVKELHDRDLRMLKTPRRFQLRRCFWEDLGQIPKADYCDLIRVAVLCCPQVEVLSISVDHAAALQYLTALKFLTSLDISLCLVFDYRNEFHSLLYEIGSRLQHLTVTTHDSPVCVNTIADNCPNLRTLRLQCQTTANEGVQPSINLRNLEHLGVFESDRQCLYFLLSSCLHLKGLFLFNCVDLDDEILIASLRKNPFEELEIAIIQTSHLSESGCKRLVQSAVKLTKCNIESYILSDDEVTRCMKDVNPSVSHWYGIGNAEQFFHAVNRVCWL